MPIHNDTYQCQPIPINTYNTCHMYKTYKYISIQANTCTYHMSVHANTYQYLQCIPKTIHTNIYHNTYHANTCQYMPQNKPQYMLIHTMKSNTCQYTHITSLMICMMILLWLLLRRLACSSWLVDLVLIFGLPSNRICDIFPVFLYLNFEQTLRRGARNLKQQCYVANFFMNVCTTVHCNQLAEVLGH